MSVDERDKRVLEDGEVDTGSMGLTGRACVAWKLDLQKPPSERIVRSPLRHVCERESKIKGMWLEFGVFSGKTINLMAQFAPSDIKVYGFDTFTGLPEDWRGEFKKGQFDCKGKLPPVADNVELVQGLFQDTLVPFLERKRHRGDSSIAVAHLDADLYSATIFVLKTLAPRIRVGTLLVFDELINYKGYEEHEWKAMLEAMVEFGWTFEWIAQSGVLEDPVLVDIWETQQVACRITGVNVFK